MQQAILDFSKQFTFSPDVENASRLTRKPHILVAGMGGSHLAADILKGGGPELDLFVHSDYGLPSWSEERFKKTLFIASSYSGNTEEVLDAYMVAGELGVERAAVSVGGRLLEMAERDGVPFVRLPDTGIQPRNALGFSLIGLANLLGLDGVTSQLALLATSLDTDRTRKRGMELAGDLGGSVPVVCASRANQMLAYNWKIKCNETGKTPAFFNVFPELNHNEMNGFDRRHDSMPPSEQFSFVFFMDDEDDPRLQKRMRVTARMYRDRGYVVAEELLQGSTRFERIFNALLVGDWMALSLAERYGLEAEPVPMVEAFKTLI